MPCLVAGIAAFFPRHAIVLIAIFSDWLGDAYDTWGWPLLGFFFMPYTTLGYALAWHWGGGDVALPGVVLIVVTVLLDLSAHTSAGHGGKRRLKGRKLD